MLAAPCRANRNWFRFPAHLVKDLSESRHRQWIEARHGSLLQLNLLYIDLVIYDYSWVCGKFLCYDIWKSIIIKLIIKNIKIKTHI